MQDLLLFHLSEGAVSIERRGYFVTLATSVFTVVNVIKDHAFNDGLILQRPAFNDLVHVEEVELEVKCVLELLDTLGLNVGDAQPFPHHHNDESDEYAGENYAT